METILPVDLLPSAVYPQCLDNQYVSDPLWAEITSRGWTFESEGVHQKRRSDVHREFIRSLVYANQLVVNRSNLPNNQFLVEFFDGKDENSRAAFDKLITPQGKGEKKVQAIVPFLNGEESLVPDPKGYDVHQAGLKAVAELEQRVGSEMRVVQLGSTKSEQRDNALLLAAKFQLLGGLDLLSKDEVGVMLSELTKRNNLEDAEIEAFRGDLDKLSSFVRSKGRELRDEGGCTRNHVYGEFFVRPGTKVSSGELWKNPKLAYPRQLQKLVDLRYNSAIPDALERYAFAPVGFPARTALVDQVSYGTGNTLHELVYKFQHGSLFFEAQHEDMQLPEFADFTLDDVLSVRDMPTWSAFSEAQLRLLEEHRDDPIHHLIENFGAFRENLIVFQESLNNKYRRLRAEANRVKCGRRIELVLQWAGRLVPLTADPRWVIPVEVAKLTWEKLPESSKQCSIDLLVRVGDLNGPYRDISHSYQIAGLKIRNEIKKAELREAIAELTRSAAPAIAQADPSAVQSRM